MGLTPINQLYDEEFALMYHCKQLYSDVEEMLVWERQKFISLLSAQFEHEKRMQDEANGLGGSSIDELALTADLKTKDGKVGRAS